MTTKDQGRLPARTQIVEEHRDTGERRVHIVDESFSAVARKVAESPPNAQVIFGGFRDSVAVRPKHVTLVRPYEPLLRRPDPRPQSHANTEAARWRTYAEQDAAARRARCLGGTEIVVSGQATRYLNRPLQEVVLDVVLAQDDQFWLPDCLGGRVFVNRPLVDDIQVIR